MDIKFIAQGQNLTRGDSNLIASGAVQSLDGLFEFDSAWDNLTIWARFEGARGIYNVRIDPETNKCFIPWEVLECPHFEVSCYGTKAQHVILTTKKCLVKVYPSIDNYEFEPLPDSPEIIEQYEQIVQHAEEVAERLLQWAEEGRFDGRDGVCTHTSIDPSTYAFYIDYATGMLVLAYAEGTTPPNYYIDDDGNLILEIE